jgi:hypothetical protein
MVNKIHIKLTNGKILRNFDLEKSIKVFKDSYFTGMNDFIKNDDIIEPIDYVKDSLLDNIHTFLENERFEDINLFYKYLPNNYQEEYKVGLDYLLINIEYEKQKIEDYEYYEYLKIKFDEILFWEYYDFLKKHSPCGYDYLGMGFQYFVNYVEKENKEKDLAHHLIDKLANCGGFFKYMESFLQHKLNDYEVKILICTYIPYTYFTNNIYEKDKIVLLDGDYTYNFKYLNAWKICNYRSNQTHEADFRLLEFYSTKYIMLVKNNKQFKGF